MLILQTCYDKSLNMLMLRSKSNVVFCAQTERYEKTRKDLLTHNKTKDDLRRVRTKLLVSCHFI